MMLMAPSAARAQRVDSATVAAKPAKVDTSYGNRVITGPPISPKRALLYSLLVPGLGQARLDRANAGALYVTVEAVSLAMIQKTRRSLGTAEAYRDSAIVGYSTTDSVAERHGIGFGSRMDVRYRRKPIKEPSQPSLRIRSRKTQVEDWMAVLLFNHFFSGADAFVAAQLWDLPTILRASPTANGAAITGRIYW